ncbi:MAG: hypothetical protein ACRDD1_13645 [Planctomycetia bacterium]
MALKFAIVLAAVAVGALGCGGGADQLATRPVRGTVTIDGKPLSGGTVMFIPTDGGRYAKGAVDSKGNFTLGTYRNADGAVVGPHRVAIACRKPGSGPDDPGKSSIPEFYGNPDFSELSFEVKPDGDNTPKFALMSGAMPPSKFNLGTGGVNKHVGP